MKQKLFTLLTLALFFCSGAEAAVNNTTVTKPGGSQKYIDVATTAASSGDEVTVTNQYIAYTISELVANTIKGVWYTQASSGSGSSESSSISITGYRSSNSKYISISSSATHTFYVTNCISFSAIYDPRSGGRYLEITATNVDDAEDELTVKNSGTVASGTYYNVSLEGLSASKYYRVVVKTDNGSNSRLGQIRLEASSTDPTISAADASITATESGVEATQGIAVTGSNLTGSTLTATLSPAVAGMSVTLGSSTISAGAISTTATLHYTKTENAKGTTTLVLSDGTTTKNVKVTYKANITPWTLQSISEATTWDFTSKVSGEKQYTTDDDKATEHVYANIDGLTYSDGFNAEALAFTGEYPFRSDSKKFAQNGCFRLITTVPGTLKFTFSNTGSSNKNRYLKVNSQNGTVEADGTTDRTEIFGVPAGEIIIKNVSGDDFTTLSALCYKKIEFVPTVDGDAVTVTSAGYASVVLANDAYFAATPSVTAYAAKANGTSITLTAVSKAPAGTPLVIKASADDYTLQKGGTGVDSPAAVAASINDLQAGPVTGDGASHYVLGKEGGKVGFGLLANGVDLPATKAYIDAALFSARGFIAFDEDGETTGVQELKNSKIEELKSYYNLNGQRVAQPTKGLYIVNGKKVLVK